MSGLKSDSKFKKVLNIVFKTCIVVTALFTTLIFVMACIGSCTPKTATVKADNEILIYSDGNYFTPMSNFYLSNSGLNMIPNKDSKQSFLMGTDVLIVREYNEQFGYVPRVAVRSCFALSSHWFTYKYHRNGTAGEYSANSYSYGGVSYQLLNKVSFSINDEDYGFFKSMFYYGQTETYPNNWYSCIQYYGDSEFNNDVVLIKYSSSVVDTIDGYSASCIVNTVTYFDRNNNRLSLNFYCANAWGSSPVTAVLWEERSYYIDRNKGAYTEGYTDGYEQGYNDSSAGYDNGYNDGFNDGFDDGRVEGYDVGYNDGYIKGYQLGSDSKLTYGSFFASVLSIFDIPIFGFISLGDIFKFIFVISMGIWALKLFAGG